MKRLTPNPDATSEAPTERDLDLLATLAWIGFATTGQLERLHYPSIRVAQRRLRALFDHGFLRAHLPSGQLHAPTTWTLTPLALETLAERRGAENLPAHPARIPRLQKLAHAIACREPFVVLRRLERENRLTLSDYLFDLDLAAYAPCVETGVIPDGLAVIRRGSHDVALVVEVDLATETTTVLRDKMHKLALLLPRLRAAARTVRVLFLATTPARVRTITSIANEAAVPSDVHALGELEALAGRGYPFAVFARAVRAERTAPPLGEAVFRATGG